MMTYSFSMKTFVQACLRNYVSASYPQTVHEMRGLALTLSTESASSPATHLRILRSTNHSSNKPYLEINYEASFTVGNATTYRVKPVGNPNCVGYAFETDNFINIIWGTGVTNTYSGIIDRIVSEAAPYANSIRVVAMNSSVTSSEYRIAGRFPLKSAYSANAGCHMLVQTSDGGWAHKDGTTASVYLGDINPEIGVSNSYWLTYTDNSAENGYSTSTIYFAFDPLHR